jgi:hypothetical protein
VRSLLAGLRTLILPWGAGPNDPAIVLGEDVPAELVAYYNDALDPGLVQRVQLFRVSATDYEYLALIEVFPTTTAVAMGKVSAGTVREAIRWSADTSIGEGNDGSWGALFVNGPLVVHGRSPGWGPGQGAAATANTGAIGAETVTLTLPSQTYTDGRAYRFEVRQVVQGSAAGNQAIYRIRRGTTVAGTLISGTFSRRTELFFDDHSFNAVIKNNSGADITTQLVLTAQVTAGTITVFGGANLPRALRPSDCGTAADFATEGTQL